MGYESLMLIGIVVSILFYELSSVSPGGLIVPGYFAVAVGQPGRMIVTLIIAAIGALTTRALSFVIVLYGRRRLAVAILATLAAYGIMTRLSSLVGISLSSGDGFDIIGWIVPGILAYELDKQGPSLTLPALASASAFTWMTAWILA
jgi:poly-gamma-glutamate biosynthesis protein PgsC/CapC